MNKTKTTEAIDELLQIVRDGEAFYGWAAEQPVSPPLRAVFLENARDKARLAAELDRVVVDRGAEPSPDGTLGGALRKLFAELRAALASDKGRAVVGQLEEAEDRLLHAFERVLAETTSAEARDELAALLPAVRTAHQRMKQLKDALAA